MIDLNKLAEINNYVGVALEVYEDGRYARTPDYRAQKLDWADIDLLHAYLVDRARWKQLGIESEEEAKSRAESLLNSKSLQ